MDIEIFKLVKSQSIHAFALLLAMREFAIGKGLQNDVDRLNNYIEENKHVIAIANDQLLELEQTHAIYRMGFFETIKTL